MAEDESSTDGETESTDDESEIGDEETETENEQRGLSDTDDAASDAGNETENGIGGLDDLQKQREWSFTVEAPNGKLVEFAGSDPDTDDAVAELTSPSADASLLYWRTVQHLNTSPELDEEMWFDLNPKFRGQIASKHLDEFGLEDFMSDDQVEQIMKGLQQQAENNQANREN